MKNKITKAVEINNFSLSFRQNIIQRGQSWTNPQSHDFSRPFFVPLKVLNSYFYGFRNKFYPLSTPFRVENTSRIRDL